MEKFNFSKKQPYDLDQNDNLKLFREKFNFPLSNPIYFCGHSLGLQPKIAKQFVMNELDAWEKLAVDGHMNGDNPWFDYHSLLTESMSNIVGAKAKETIVMNSLTTNLHMLMISFFTPNKDKYKIMIDTPTFPSDKYAVQSQLKLHGLDPKKDLVEINTFENNECLPDEMILDKIKSNMDNVALILLSGVNYYTGQLYNMNSISEIAHNNDCMIGLDLAHAAGNVKLYLNQWNIDFASWCGYKYLNGGPGAPSGAFIHEKHHNKNLQRLEGWWGHNKEKRFNPPKKFEPINSAEAWQLSNPPILSMAALRASLKLFDSAGMDDLSNKSKHLTSYLEHLILSLNNKNISIITPSNSNERGAQLSFQINSKQKEINSFLKEKNIICDFRKPNVIRAAPCAFYNSFTDIYDFVEALKEL